MLMNCMAITSAAMPIGFYDTPETLGNRGTISELHAQRRVQQKRRYSARAALQHALRNVFPHPHSPNTGVSKLPDLCPSFYAGTRAELKLDVVRRACRALLELCNPLLRGCYRWCLDNLFLES